jgi:tetratricopeptide (TPR) repeat protein
LLLALLLGCSKKAEIARFTAQAYEAEQRGDSETAIARWTSTLQLDSKNSDAYLRRAVLYENSGKWNDAIADYTEYLRLPTNSPSKGPDLPFLNNRDDGWQNPALNHSFALCRRGFLHAKEGDFEKALVDLDQAIRLNPDDPNPYGTRAQVLEFKGDPEQALASLTKAIQIAPGDATGYILRGAFQARRGKIKEAIADLDKALKLEPSNSKALTHRGLVYGTHGELEKGLDDLNEAIRLNPEEPDFYSVRGALFLQIGDFESAFADYNHTLGLRPHEPAALARRGYALSRKGKIELALADLNEAIRLNPAEPWFYAWRGSVYSATNEFEKGISDMNRAIETNPSQAEFYAIRGYIYNKQQDFAKAAADFTKGVSLNPGSPEACNNLAWLRATCPEETFRNGKEALEIATHGCEITGYKIHNLVDTLAAAYAETGDFDQAIKYQQTCLALPNLPENKRPDMQQRLALYQEHKPFRQKSNP